MLHKIRMLAGYLIRRPLLSLLALALGGIGAPVLILMNFVTLGVISSIPALIICMEVMITFYDYFVALRPCERNSLLICVVVTGAPVLLSFLAYLWSENLVEFSALVAISLGIALLVDTHLLQRNSIPIPRFCSPPLRKEEHAEEYRLQLWWICRVLGQMGFAGVGYGAILLIKTHG